MSKQRTVQKKALKKRLEAKDQSTAYMESLKADFEFVIGLVHFGSRCMNENGDLQVDDLLCVDYTQFTPIQNEIIKNFQRYVLLDKYGAEGIVSVEPVDDRH